MHSHRWLFPEKYHNVRHEGGRDPVFLVYLIGKIQHRVRLEVEQLPSRKLSEGFLLAFAGFDLESLRDEVQRLALGHCLSE